jgi:hypothetical protein
MNKHKELQKKLDRMKELVLEHERSIKAESCEYQLVIDETGINSQNYGSERYGKIYIDDTIQMMYFLIDLKTKEVIRAGFKRRIAQFIRSRQISPDKILDFDLFKLTYRKYLIKKYDLDRPKLCE